LTGRADAVIVAAGASRRFGSETPKQFLPVRGQPLLVHTIARIRASEEIDDVVVVLPRNGFDAHQEHMRQFVDDAHLAFVAGGETRQDSVWAGLECVGTRGDDDLILVHDGARPLADVALIDEVISRASQTGGAIAAVPVVETLKEVGGELTIRRTVDRKRFYRAQTPQCFRYELLRSAFEAARDDGFFGTDEASLVERRGATISIVVGSEHNIKVTTREDLSRVEYFLAQDAP